MLKEKVLTFNRQVAYNKRLAESREYYFRRHLFFSGLQCSGERRKKILAFLVQYDRLAVNCSNTVQIKQDRDLQKLLKDGKIKLIKDKMWRNNHRQYAVIA